MSRTCFHITICSKSRNENTRSLHQREELTQEAAAAAVV